MKTTDYSTQRQFEALLTKGRKQSAPEVNVRARVRMVLEQQGRRTSGFEDISDTLVRWFSGLRGGVFAGVVIMTVFLVGFYLVNQASVLSQEEADGVTVFMDSGDWSEFI